MQLIRMRLFQITKRYAIKINKRGKIIVLIIIQIIILMVDILDMKMKRMYNSYLSGIAYIYIGDICTGLL